MTTERHTVEWDVVGIEPFPGVSRTSRPEPAGGCAARLGRSFVNLRARAALAESESSLDPRRPLEARGRSA